jgi:hypothetical protein
MVSVLGHQVHLSILDTPVCVAWHMQQHHDDKYAHAVVQQHTVASVHAT